MIERLQRYNCIWLTYIVNVERNILFYIKVWSCEILSLCGKLIWRWNVVFWLRLSIQKKVVQKTFYEPLRSLEASQLTLTWMLASWLFTFGWEPVCFENFWKCFDSFWTHLVEKWVYRFVAAGIVSTNLYLKNLRFVNWKPGIEFTSWDIGSREWCQKFI